MENNFKIPEQSELIIRDNREIIVPEGIRFISDWKDYSLAWFQFQHILDKKIPGCGYTEYCIRNDQPLVLTSPRVFLLKNKAGQLEIISKNSVGDLALKRTKGYTNAVNILNTKAKEYIDQYLTKYSGIKNFMADIVEKTKKLGYVETLYKRRRYVPELKSNNYMVRQFGARVCMNTPIQGTAADIMKIAMINVFNKLKNMKSKLILQVHDELLIETFPDEIENVKKILKYEMENVIKLSVPLKVDINEGKNWYEAK